MDLALSFDEILSAWERVQENDGCAGSDGVTLREFAGRAMESLTRLISRITEDRYVPFPLLKIVVEKSPGSDQTRTLLVPTVQDRILQTAVARELSRSFEEEFLECSYAYRPGRGVDRAVARIRELHLEGYQFIVDADIRTFFDEVSHDILLDRLALQRIPAAYLCLVRMWLRGEFWDGVRVLPIHKGVPQGSPISPLLANFFLEDFDARLEQSGCRLVRYADDFLILTKSRPEAENMLGQTKVLLDSLHLDLNLDKTRITDFDQGFRFLGVLFHGDGIWIPWKTDRKQGRLISMARPLPQYLRRRYELGSAAQTVMAQALRRSCDGDGDEGASLISGAVPERSHFVAFLYLTQQGAVLRKAGDRLLVEKDDQVLLDIPYHKLDHVLLFGNVQVTTQAIAELLEKGVAFSLFSRQGNLRGSLSPAKGKNVELRLKQFQAYSNPERATGFARETVRAKVANGAAVIARYRARAPERNAPALDVATRLESVASAKNVAELDGLEGASARDYFEALMRFNRSGFLWEGRKKHPAPDPLNALLSLTYTLLMNELAAVLEGLGLDPFLGFLHQMDYGRPSLALDVVEPFRYPVADRLVLQLCNKRVLSKEDFQTREDREGLYLKPDALVRYFEVYEKWLLNRPPGQPSFRERLNHEAEKVVAWIRDGGSFHAYCFDHEAEEDECSTSSVTI